VIAFGLSLTVVGYALFLRIGLDSSYLAVLFPTFTLVGFAFGFAYAPLNIAATNGVDTAEQGLASGIVQTSFQFGGALVLAIVTAVNASAAGTDGTPQALLDGFHSALIVPVIVAAVGVVVTVLGLIGSPRPTPSATAGARA
jgi:sugar phosphate permease